MNDREIIQEATDCLTQGISAEGENRQSALDDLRFANGEQWPAALVAQREMENRPALTINKTATFVRQVVNNMRQQRPRMVAHPVGNGADQDVAEVIQGMLRHIEVNSGADVAYDTAGGYQVQMGWGFMRVSTKYVDERSFLQEIHILPVKNPFTVYLDPASELPDGSDAEWCIVTDTMDRKRFKRKYPNAQEVQFAGGGQGDRSDLWGDAKSIRIAEYWKVEKTAEKLVVLSTGWTGFRSEMSQMVKTMLDSGKVTVEQERDSHKRTVRYWKVTGQQVLEAKVWPGKWIPIVPVYGDELTIDGKVTRKGMVRDLKDPARMYNYWRTSEAEIVALAPKAPWVMAEGQAEGREDQWDTANTKSYSRLEYKPVYDDSGAALPPPQRQSPQQIPAANVTAAQGASEDMKAVSGIFDPSLGVGERDPSGTALRMHQGQADVSNFHFYDNMTRSVRHMGRICLDLFPTIYDTERTMRIIGEDGESQMVTINQKQRDDIGAVQKVLNDVTVGLYDIVMDTGPGYATKRIEAADHMMQLLGTPLGAMVAKDAGDIVIRNFDWPGARELANRLAAANPIAVDEMIPGLPAQAQALVKGLQTQLQQAQQVVQGLQLQIKTRQDVEQVKQQGEMAREHMRATVKAHNTEEIAATKRHDTEVRALSAQNVEEIRALVQLLLKHVDGTHLEREIEAQDRQLEAKSNEIEPAQG